jgi:hypothetical protein
MCHELELAHSTSATESTAPDVPHHVPGILVAPNPQFEHLLTEITNSALINLASPEPPIAIASLLSLYRGLQKYAIVTAPICLHEPFFRQLCEFLADPQVDPVYQDLSLQILRVCAKIHPDCLIFRNSVTLDHIVQLLPSPSASHLLAHLCRHFPSIVEYLPEPNLPSILTNLLCELTASPFVQYRLLQLIECLPAVLQFGAADWANFFRAMRQSLAIRILHPCSHPQFLRVLRCRGSDPVARAFEVEVLPILWRTFLTPRMGQDCRLALLEYLMHLVETSPEHALILLDQNIASRLALALPKWDLTIRSVLAVAFGVAKHSQAHCARMLTPEFWEEMAWIMETGPFAGKRACGEFLLSVLLLVPPSETVEMIARNMEMVIMAIDMALGTTEEEVRMTAMLALAMICGKREAGPWAPLAGCVLEYLDSEDRLTLLDSIAHTPDSRSAELAQTFIANVLDA